MQRHIHKFIGPPDALTIANLLCGVFSIGLTAQGKNYALAVLLLPLGAIFDAFDGVLARKLKRESSFGADLDSLADLVTFGVAPFALLTQYYWHDAITVCAALIPVCGALRLARHNTIRHELKGYLVGLPIDASAAVVPLLLILNSPVWLTCLVVLALCGLYLSTLRVNKLL